MSSLLYQSNENDLTRENQLNSIDGKLSDIDSSINGLNQQMSGLNDGINNVNDSVGNLNDDLNLNFAETNGLLSDILNKITENVDKLTDFF